MDAASNQRFLEEVVVWPGPDGSGWINLHTHGRNNDPKKNEGKPYVIGWPFKKVTDLIDRARWLGNTSGQFFDAWYCTSQQRDCAKTTAGKPKALRGHRNATWLKAIWVDVDVGNKLDPVTGQPETKHYDTAAEAWAAVSAWRKKVGLPAPSAIVNSGGGLHIYWISDQPLTPVDWRPYAEGLKALLLTEGVKCDAGLTTDDVRILRVPGTLNHKYNPPRPVVLLHLGQMYNFGTDLRFLNECKIDPSAAQNSSLVDHIVVTLMEPGVDWSAPDPAFASLDPTQALAAGVAPTGAFLVDPEPVFEQCGFLGHAKATGGIDYDNPLWNLSVLCTAFMENGNALAHEISRSHPTYSAAGTQAQFDQKVADRADRGIGYPSCGTIAGAGCKSCATCPLFSKGKSPLNIRPAFTAAVTQSAKAAELNLPDNYEIDAQGIVGYWQSKLLKDGSSDDKWCPLFRCSIDDAYVTKNPDGLHIHISTDKGNWKWASFKPRDLVGQGIEKVLMDQSMIFNSAYKVKLEDFFLAFIDKMYKAAQAQNSVSLGWHQPNGKIEGFSFAKRLYRDDGSNIPAGMTDRMLQDRFMPKGELAAWHDAWKFIQMQHRPDLEVCVAAAFAAPLIELTGQTGMLLSCVGETGSGKTFAMELGCAVWGHPKTTKEGANSTEKSVINRMGHTSNLPAYWDEVSDEQVQFKVLKLMDATTSGVEASRLNSKIEQQDRGTWTTVVVINGNRRFKEYIVQKQRDHAAGLNRVLEYWCERNPDGQVGQISNTSIPDKALKKLQHNFGNVGLEYARMLAVNHVAIQGKLNQRLAAMSQQFGQLKEERMWLSLCAALITGAELANTLPTPVGFDVDAMYQFLAKVYRENAEQRKNSHTDPSKAEYGGDYLAQYLKDRSMETIWTKAQSYRPPGHGGRPSKVDFYRLMPNVALTHGVNVRWDKQDNTLRFSAKNFEEWCDRDDGRVFSVIKDSLVKNYLMTKERRSLCAGCSGFEATQEWVFKIDVTPYPDLYAVLNSNEPVSLNSELGTPVGVVTPEQLAAAAGNITLAEQLIK